jgi:hypothetical protein
MLDIYFSNSNDEILKIPYVPYDFLIGSSVNNETFETSEGKILTLKGIEGLKSFSLESFFPTTLYSFLPSTTQLSKECLEYLVNNLKENLRVIVTDGDETLINMLCTISNFNYSKKQNLDISYSLEVTEYIDPLEVV